ncbi:MAG: spore germination protein [Bacillota bacterium]
MFRIIKRMHRKSRILKENAASGSDSKNKPAVFLTSELKKNLELFRDILDSSPDIIIREFNFGHEKKASGALLYVDGLTNRDLLDNSVLKPLMFDDCFIANSEDPDMSDIDTISKNLIAASDIKKKSDMDDILDDLLSGNAIVLIDSFKEALSIGNKKWDKRSVSEPSTEALVRGPRDGFTESIRTNTALLRRRMKNTDLCFENFKIGKRTKTDVSVAYIKGIVMPGLVEEIKKRLNRIQTDAVLESGYIEAFIEDAPHSIFSTVGNTERPDTVAAKILEGRAAIFVDGTPFVLTVPMLFVENFVNPEDYYIRPYFASYIRFIRYLCYFVAVFSPAIYVALTTFHQELIPTQLLFTMSAGVSGVPFPAAVEAALMLITFDILREAGIRLPIAVGQAVSIVGALVIGQASVSAGLIGPFMVIIIAITAVCSFVVSSLNDSSTLLRYFFVILAALMGGFGIAMGLLFILLHLISLRSFGVPYLSPLAPLTLKDLKDTLVRLPHWAMGTRPRVLARRNRNRQKPDLMPQPPDAKNIET